MDTIREFMTKYINTQLFNSLLRTTTVPDEDSTIKAALDPQEYFDEVSAAAAQAISKCIVPENVTPNLFKSTVEYSVYPISESVVRNNVSTITYNNSVRCSNTLEF